MNVGGTLLIILIEILIQFMNSKIILLLVIVDLCVIISINFIILIVENTNISIPPPFSAIHCKARWRLCSESKTNVGNQS